MLFLTFLLLAAGAVPGVPAQRLRVVSEFQRYTPWGEVAAEDRVEHPREIISPAVARNGYATFRAVVQLPAGAQYNLHIAQNPEGLLRARLYQENYAQQDEAWVPNTLREVPLSLGARLQDQTAQSYLLDLWTPPDIKPQRIRVEVQLSIGDEWTIVPLEIRVSNAIVPALEQQWAGLKAYACGAKELADVRKPEETLDWILFRNAQQDIALARAREKDEAPAAVADTIARAAGFDSRDRFCGAAPSAIPRGAEWPLRARDFLIQGLPVR